MWFKRTYKTRRLWNVVLKSYISNIALNCPRHVVCALTKCHYVGSVCFWLKKHTKCNHCRKSYSFKKNNLILHCVLLDVWRVHWLYSAYRLRPGQPEPVLHPPEDIPAGPEPTAQPAALVGHLRQEWHRVQPHHVTSALRHRFRCPVPR